MRTAAATTFFLVLGACSGPSSDPQAPASGPDATIDPSYCTKYCEAQARDGTLTGSIRDCEHACCLRVPEGCGDVDAATTDGGSHGGDASHDASDGSTCAIPCGTQCCGSNQACGKDSLGNAACVETCKTKADCPSGCCAPATNAAGEPVGPYVCKPDDGEAYDCCYGATVTCTTGHCCVDDAAGNQFCALPCSSNTACGAGHCVDYTFSIFNTTCGGPTACGP